MKRPQLHVDVGEDNASSSPRQVVDVSFRAGELITAQASTSERQHGSTDTRPVPVRGRKGGSNGVVKLPAIARTNKYGLGQHAIKALRDAQETGTLPTQTHSFSLTLGATGLSRSQLTTASNTTSNRGVHSPGFVPSPFCGTLVSRTPSPSLLPGASPNASLPASAVGRQRSPHHVTRASTAQLPQPSATLSSQDPADPSNNPAVTHPAATTTTTNGDELDDDPLPALNPDDDELTERLLSLPNIMCHAANGDVFLVGLKDVQTMLHKRRLGPAGLQVLRRFENATSCQWDIVREKASDSYSLKWRQRHEHLLANQIGQGEPQNSQDGMGAQGGAAGAVSPTMGRRGQAGAGNIGKAGTAVGAAVDATLNLTLAGLGMGSAGLSEELEAEVAAHLEASMAAVEQHRLFLQANSAKSLAEVAKVEALEAAKKKKSQAVDFVVKHLIPEKILAMANTRRGKAPPGSQLFRKMKASLAPDAPRLDTTAETEESSTPRGSGARHWVKLKTRTEDVFANMPFMENWNAALTKLRREDKSGWDELLQANNVYIKGGNTDSQGAAVYVYKCQQLGVVPSTQVVQQLRCPEANMAHCKLGRRGAQALRHALATNTTITSLDLSDNALDAQAVAEVLSGLAAGAWANVHHKTRKSLVDKWAKLDWVKAFQRPSPDDQIMAVPESIRQVLESKKKEAEGEDPGADPTSSPPRSPSSPGARLQGSKRDNSPTRLLIDAPPQHSSDTNVGRLASAAIHNMSERKTQLPSTKQPGSPGGGLLTSILSRVQVLDLSGNLLGVNGAKVIANLLNPLVTGHQFLTQLRINKCGIPEAGGMAIFAGMATGNNTLAILSMSNNSCGNAAAASLGQLLKVNVGLKEIDLSWNQIKPEGMMELCAGLEQNATLEKLSLAWNGLEDQGVVRVGQMLQVNKGLKHLDLTNTRMGGEACLMLGEGIKANKALEDLILNGNAVGDDGARHLMSALKQNETLQFLGLQGSNMSTAARGQSGASDFNPLSPDGAYSLSLSSPADRAVAVQLCTMEVSGKGEMMRNVRLEGRSITSVKGMHWPESLPVSGMLTFDFVSRRAQKTIHVMDHKKFQALVGQLDSASMSDKEKTALVDVMAPFNLFYCKQIAHILRCFGMGDELVRSAALLFTRAADLEENIGAMTAAMQERDIHGLHQQLGWYSYFRFCNPTGHYELNLATHVDQALASRLKDVAYSETCESSNWHNIIHDLYSTTAKVAHNYGPPEAWKGIVPSRGTLSFDYVSNVLAAEDTEPISDEQLVDFLHHCIGISFNNQGQPIPDTDFGDADQQVALLRQEVGHQFHFRCTQVIKIMSCFLAGPHKVEVAVMMYCLIVDRKNFWTVMYSLRSFEQGLLMWRLGPNAVFDRSHPTGHYVLDLNNHHHEQVARRLIELAASNSEVPNFWNIRLQGNKKSMVENRNMWGAFTAETTSPWLEFDFIGPDAGEALLNKNKADWESATKGDKLEAITKLARRMEMQRIKDMYGHFWDGSGWAAPMWRSGAQLFKPLINKPPWLAAWDRLMRLLVRYDMRSGDIQADSYIEDIFDTHCNEEGELTSEAFTALCREWGYTRSEIHFHYQPLFEAQAKPSALKSPGAPGAGSAGGMDPAGSMSGTASTAPSPGPAMARVSEIGEAGRSSGMASPTAGSAALRRAAALSSALQQQQNTEPPVPMVIEFCAFADIFMKEPLPEQRWKEIPAATNIMAVAAAAKALKGLRKTIAGKK